MPESNRDAAGGPASSAPNDLAPSNSPPWPGCVLGSCNQGAALGSCSPAAISHGAPAWSPPKIPARGGAAERRRRAAAPRRGAARLAARVPRSAGRRTDSAESVLLAVDGWACCGRGAGVAGEVVVRGAGAARMRLTAASRSCCILACSRARGLSIQSVADRVLFGSMRWHPRAVPASGASPSQGFAALRIARMPK
jgi:hypothetical protein